MKNVVLSVQIFELERSLNILKDFAFEKNKSKEASNKAENFMMIKVRKAILL